MAVRMPVLEEDPEWTATYASRFHGSAVPDSTEETFTGWFWKAVCSATGFTPAVVSDVKRGRHPTYDIPERKAEEVEWADRKELVALIAHLSGHLSTLQQLNHERDRRTNQRALCADYLANKQFQQLSASVTATRPSCIFFYHYFTALNCRHRHIRRLDPTLRQFESLTELNLTANEITLLENLPPRVEVVNVYGNGITEIADLSGNTELRHLGLGYNKLDTLKNLVPQQEGYLSTLLSVDLSFNNLCDLEATVDQLQTLPELKMLALVGNPLALPPNYRTFVVYHLPSLLSLDDVEITAEEREAARVSQGGELDALIASSETSGMVQVDIAVLQITGLPADPYAKPISLEPEHTKRRKDGKRRGGDPTKDAGAKPSQAKRGAYGLAGGAAAEAAPEVPQIVQQLSVMAEVKLGPHTTVTNEVVRHAPTASLDAAGQPPAATPAIAAGSGAAGAAALSSMDQHTTGAPSTEAAAPLAMGHAAQFTLPATLELRDALLRPLQITVFEVLKKSTVVPPDEVSDHQLDEHGVPVVHLHLDERKVQEIGRCYLDASACLNLLSTNQDATVEATLHMDHNEFIHMDHLYHLRKKEEAKAREEERLRVEQEEKERLERELQEQRRAMGDITPEPPAIAEKDRKGTARKLKRSASAVSKMERKKSTYGAVREAAAAAASSDASGSLQGTDPPPPPEVDPYVNLADLNVEVKVVITVNRRRPRTPVQEVEEEETDDRRVAHQKGRSRAAARAPAAGQPKAAKVRR